MGKNYIISVTCFPAKTFDHKYTKHRKPEVFATLNFSPKIYHRTKKRQGKKIQRGTLIGGNYIMSARSVRQ